eukprot:2385969-Alexandrium_andersonii.AAC.1
MSASLVGSEMCIRDRPSGSGGYGRRTGGRSSAKRLGDGSRGGTLRAWQTRIWTASSPGWTTASLASSRPRSRGGALEA